MVAVQETRTGVLGVKPVEIPGLNMRKAQIPEAKAQERLKIGC